MKNLRKVLLVFTLIFALGALTACSNTTNNVLENFEDEGYNSYLSKNYFAKNFNPDKINMEDYEDTSDVFRITDKMTIDLIENYDNLEVIEDLNYEVYIVGFYEENDDEEINKTLFIIEFPSVDYLDEVLEVSQTLQDHFSGKDREDYTRENLLLVVHPDYDEYFDEMAEIFNREG
ncbi:MAG: hypothetical protein ACQERX_02465 [Bacillota bacterium]